MPIENSYRNSKEKFTVSEVSEKYHQSFETIIVTFQSKVLQGLLDSKFIIEIPDRKFGTSNSKYPIYKLTKQENVLFYLSPIGAPATVGILEEIIYAFDVKNIIMYGSCGVLDRKIAAGKIIVPTKAYRDEGTSYHYQPSSEFIDLKENSFVSSVLKNNGMILLRVTLGRQMLSIGKQKNYIEREKIKVALQLRWKLVLFRHLSI